MGVPISDVNSKATISRISGEFPIRRPTLSRLSGLLLHYNKDIRTLIRSSYHA